MKIKLEQPLGLNETGRRENNEDAYYPFAGKAHPQDMLYIVCDGIGGAAKGEVASNTVCREISEFFEENNITASSKDTIELAVEKAEGAIDDYLRQNPDAHGMGTTLSLLHLHPDGATVAWCGDSRVYQVRGKEIIFKTIDHTHVNNLLKAGIITPEEAQDHPDKHLITRAVQGTSVKKAKVDVTSLDDIHSGDMFFLCTDGVVEALDEDQLIDILAKGDDLSSKINAINNYCKQYSQDNYTCYLVKIAKVKGKPRQKQYIPTARPATTSKTQKKKASSDDLNKITNPKRKIKIRNLPYLVIIFLGIFFSLSLLILKPFQDRNYSGRSMLENLIRGHSVKANKDIQMLKTHQGEDSQSLEAVNQAEQPSEQQTEAAILSDTLIDRDKPTIPDIEDLSNPTLKQITFLDERDSMQYLIVQILDREWFAKNLEYVLEGSLDPQVERGGRYYNWAQAQQACPDGWRLPSQSWDEMFKDSRTDLLVPVFSGHNRNDQFVKLGEEAMFWYAEQDTNGWPLYFSLDKGNNKLHIRKGHIETYKPVRCVRTIDEFDAYTQ